MEQKKTFGSYLLRKIIIVRLVAFTAAGRRQDSVTGGGGRNKFWGAQKLYLCKFKRGTGAREIYASVNQTKKIFSSKISTNSCYRLKILAIFHEFLSVDQKKKKKGLRPRNYMKSGVSPQQLRKYGR